LRSFGHFIAIILDMSQTPSVIETFSYARTVSGAGDNYDVQQYFQTDIKNLERDSHHSGFERLDHREHANYSAHLMGHHKLRVLVLSAFELWVNQATKALSAIWLPEISRFV
jgi:hypothetical protein